MLQSNVLLFNFYTKNWLIICLEIILIFNQAHIIQQHVFIKYFQSNIIFKLDVTN